MEDFSIANGTTLHWQCSTSPLAMERYEDKDTKNYYKDIDYSNKVKI